MLIGYLEGSGEHALFNFIYGLVQINSQHYIVAERFNHCLRNIQEFPWKTGNNKWETSTYAGNCTVQGRTDGPLHIARFQELLSMMKVKEILLLTQLRGESIRRIDIVTGIVTTIFRSDFRALRGLALLERNNEFYATTGHGILHIIDEKGSWLMGSLNAGTRVGNFSSAQFNDPADIKWLDNITLVVADSNNHNLKVIELETERVFQICEGESYFEFSYFAIILTLQSPIHCSA